MTETVAALGQFRSFLKQGLIGNLKKKSKAFLLSIPILIRSHRMLLECSFLFFTVLLSAAFFWQIPGEEGKMVWDFWWSKWAVLGFSASLWFSYLVAARIHWSLGIFSAWNLCYSCYYFLWYQHPGSPWWKWFSLELHNGASENAAIFLLFVSLFSFMRLYHIRAIASALGVICLLDALWLLTTCLEHPEPYWRVGFVLHNSSMDAGFIAYTLPLFWGLAILDWRTSPWPYLLSAPMIASVFYSESDMGRAAICFMFFAFAMAHVGNRRAFWLTIIAIVSCGAGLIYGTYHGMFPTSGRNTMFVASLGFFKTWASTWFGMGPGTGLFYFPKIQQSSGTTMRVGTWAWLHSDPLQIFFEQGVVGFVSASLVVYHALRRSFNRPLVFAGLVSYLFYSLGSLPTHWALSSLAGMTLLALAFRKDDNPTTAIKYDLI